MRARLKVAVVQDSSVPFDAAATTAKCCRLIGDAARQGAELVLFPEAFLGTCPEGTGCDGAVDIDGPELRDIEEAAQRHGVFVVLGIVERTGATLQGTVILIDADWGLVGMRRTTKPTGSEHSIRDFGDGSTLDVVDSPLGLIGAVAGSENDVPTMPMAMHAQGVEICCAPTTDDRLSWLPSLQQIAMEGRCYVLSACQSMRRSEHGDNDRRVQFSPSDGVVRRGASVVIDPLGSILAGSVSGERAILFAELDRDRLVRSRRRFDQVCHHAQPDPFSLNARRDARRAVRFT